tara:strand:- start:155 stop:499 length:345 start_codon:yes stop_codon:yes gene_type:complete
LFGEDMQKIKTRVDLAEGILETEEGVKAFKHRSFLMAQYHAKVSRIAENKRSQKNVEDTERLAEKYNWQLEELKNRGIARQKERLKIRGDSLKKEAEILLTQIEEHNSILRGES